VADIDDFDIDRSIAQAWAEFQARLSDIVSMIDDSADLTIGTGSASDDPGPYLRLSSPRRTWSGVRRRATPCSARTFSSDRQLAAMERLGWQPPPATGQAATEGPGQLLARAAPGRGRPDQRAGRRRAPGRLRGAAPIFLRPTSWPRCCSRRHPDRGSVRAAPAELAVRPYGAIGRGHHAQQSASPGGAGRRRAGRHVRLPADPRRRGDIAIRVGSTMLFCATAPTARR
jgi:hypothetical protein